MNNIGPKVYELRQRRDMTQAELAKLVGTDRAIISRIENSIHGNLTMSLVDRLASALKTTAAELLR
jgi:transcriptional regulator with XRE-family HTH domain